MGKLSKRVTAAVLIVLGLIFSCSCLPATPNTVLEDGAFWHKVGLAELKKRLEFSKGKNLQQFKAKNIIIFIGDGMGMTTITAGRIFKGQESGQKGEEADLTFDNFPHTGLAKTYDVDTQVPDSAATATAMFCGVKTLYGVAGMDATRTKDDPKKGRAPSIMNWAQAEGKRTGIVTTTRITHATPAATYAGTYNRDWECDSMVPQNIRDQHMDIARQLVEADPGKRFNVILGGGLKPMGNENFSETKKVNFTGNTEYICRRGDGRNLTDEWLRLESVGKRQFVQTRTQLKNLDAKNTDHVLGLFRNNHITYKIAAEDEEPSLEEMVEQAIKVLDRKDSPGYVLMVEGGRIDQAHHRNYARAAMVEMVEFDKAIGAALQATSDSETLIIVTADHSHALTFNGYPKRGNDILGLANKSASIEPYETLTYANGPGYKSHRLKNSVDGDTSSKATWIPVHELGPKRLEPTYQHLAAFQLDEMDVMDETHGGEDVVVFATGPGSALVRGVFEQNYIAYLMSYAGCMGPAKYVDGSCRPNAKDDLVSSGQRMTIPWSQFIIIGWCTFVVLGKFKLFAYLLS